MSRLGAWTIIGTLALLAAGPASGQGARLHVLADSVSVGERFEIAVAVDHRAGVSATFPRIPEGDPEAGPLLTFGDVEAVGVRRLPPTVRGGIRTDSAVYIVAAFAVDQAAVGPVEVALRPDSLAAVTGVVTVPVRSELTGAPPHAPTPLGPPDSFPSSLALWAIIGVLGLALVGGAAWALVRALRNRPAAPAGRLAPYPAALARLGALDAETPTTPEAVEAHVVAVRDVVRTFAGRRLGVAAREATTAELEAALRADRRVPDAAVEAVRAALLPTDLVAFARVRPAGETVARIRASGRAAVEAVEAAVEAVEAATRAAEAEAHRAKAGSDGASPTPQSPS